MKKTMALVLVVCFVLMLTACTAGEPKPEQPPASSAQTEPKAEKKITDDLITPIDAELNQNLQTAVSTMEIVGVYDTAIGKMEGVVAQYKTELTAFTGAVKGTADYTDAASLKAFVEKAAADFTAQLESALAERQKTLAESGNAGSAGQIDLSAVKYNRTKEFAEKLKGIYDGMFD